MLNYNHNVKVAHETFFLNWYECTITVECPHSSSNLFLDNVNFQYEYIVYIKSMHFKVNVLKVCNEI